MRVAVRDKAPRCLTPDGGLRLPVAAGSGWSPFRFDGAALFWNSGTTDDDIEGFCALFKTRESRGREQAEEKRRYQALPRCDEHEQAATSCARMENERLLILPLTMFDINSFRRIQNVLLRQIVAMGRETCPCCGKG